MTKLEAIGSAYGELWEKVKNNHQYDGWIYSWGWNAENPLEMEFLEDSSITTMVRPKCLQGIETNNGWNKIVDESSLPKIQGKGFHIIFRTELGLTTTYTNEDVVPDSYHHFLRYSHWRLKQEIPEPFY